MDNGLSPLGQKPRTTYGELAFNISAADEPVVGTLLELIVSSQRPLTRLHTVVNLTKISGDPPAENGIWKNTLPQSPWTFIATSRIGPNFAECHNLKSFAIIVVN